jgi:glutathione S-transferase
MNDHPHTLVAIVTALSLLVYIWIGFRVGQARAKHGIDAPAITGHPDFERVVRVQANTLEWLPIFLPSLWLFAIYWQADQIAAAIGLVWIVGRVLYALGYSRAAGSRSTGFLIQGLATLVLLIGFLIKAVMLGLQLNWT